MGCRRCRCPAAPTKTASPPHLPKRPLRVTARQAFRLDLQKAEVTVMAVAADFHRNFLVPEEALTSASPTTVRQNRT